MDAQAYNQVLHGVYSTGHKELCAHGKDLHRALRHMWGNYTGLWLLEYLWELRFTTCMCYMHMFSKQSLPMKIEYNTGVLYTAPRGSAEVRRNEKDVRRSLVRACPRLPDLSGSIKIMNRVLLIGTSQKNGIRVQERERARYADGERRKEEGTLFSLERERRRRGKKGESLFVKAVV